jgi:hypothetical protein
MRSAFSAPDPSTFPNSTTSWISGASQCRFITCVTLDRDTPSASRWQAALDRHAQAHAMLMDAVRAFPPQRLHEAPVGGGITYELMLHGLAQRDAYHTGQAALLAKVLR